MGSARSTNWSQIGGARPANPLQQRQQRALSPSLPSSVSRGISLAPFGALWHPAGSWLPCSKTTPPAFHCFQCASGWGKLPERKAPPGHGLVTALFPRGSGVVAASSPARRDEDTSKPLRCKVSVGFELRLCRRGYHSLLLIHAQVHPASSSPTGAAAGGYSTTCNKFPSPECHQPPGFHSGALAACPALRQLACPGADEVQRI